VAETKILERDDGRAEDKGVSAREEGEGGYGGWAFCSDTGIGESLYLIANIFVFIFLAGKSTAPLLGGGGGLVVRLVEKVKGWT
jgi:hypothetical protein